MSAIETELALAVEKELLNDPHMLLMEWNSVAEAMKELKKKEIEMRNKLAAHFFPNPDEGTNTLDLGNDWKLKDKHKINRNCDEAAFTAVFGQLPEGFKDSLIKFKPELKLKEYRKLSDDHRKIFDQALTIKPGTPELVLVPPKVKK